MAQLEDVANTKHLNNLISSMEQDEVRWLQMYESSQPEQIIPEPWMTGDDSSTVSETARALKKLTIIKILRPDRLQIAVEQFAIKALGNEVGD